MADALEEAQRLYADALDASRRQRRQIEEDLAFSDPSDPQQWDEQIKAQRESDPGGARPCLVFDQLGQYIANVTGQVEQNPPGLHAVPVDGGADKKVAQQLDGYLRHIEYTSRAQQHYARVMTSAARCGVGYLVVRPEYVNRALGWQEPRISSEGDPLRVVLDPWSVDLGGGDATFGFLLSPLSHRQFEREFGKKAKKCSFGDEQRSTVEDERKSILVAEMWHKVTARETVYIAMDQEGREAEMSEDDILRAQANGQPLNIIDKRTERTETVKWARMSGDEILTPETVYPASSIGIVPVYGYVGWSNGRMTYCGMARRARDPQRSYNYHKSEIHAYMGQAPKSPWVVPVRALANLQDVWDLASVESRAYLPYNDIDERGPINEPKRPPLSVDLQNHTEQCEQALRDIQASLGMYQANLGAPSNETSGVAIEQRKQQGEASMAHFPSHLAASMTQVGKIIIDMIPRLIDERRQLRLMSEDGSTGTVTMDPKQEAAAVEIEGRGLVINPNVGRYDVRVVVGASFATQRSQAQLAFTEMMRANPEMSPAIAPLWAQTLDVPNAEKLSQVLTEMAPPAIKAILSPENEQEAQTTGQLKAQLEQMAAQMQEMAALAKDAESELDEAEARIQEAEAKTREAEAKLIGAVDEHEATQDEIAIKAFDAKTKRIQVMAAAAKAQQDAELARLQAEREMEKELTEPPEPVEPAEPVEPVQAGPSPEMQALIEAQQQLMAAQQQIMAANAKSSALLETLINVVRAPRERIPIKDAQGNTVRVIEMIAGDGASVQDKPLQ
jgi:hypothetical protein